MKYTKISTLTLSTSEPLNSTVVVLILFNLYKWCISYDSKFEEVGNFYPPTWLIFAGPVTYIYSYTKTGNVPYSGKF